MDEKRKFLRLDADIAAEYRLCREHEVDGTAFVKDVSRGGMQLSVNKKLERGALLNIKIMFDNDIKPIFLTGEIAWISESREKSDFEYSIGVKFFEIDNLDKSRILDHTYTQWVSQPNLAIKKDR